MEPRLAVMIDASPLIGTMAGIGRYTLRLIGALQDQIESAQITAYLDALRVRPARLLASLGLPYVSGRHFPIPKSLLLILWERGLASPMMLDRRAEVLHSTNYRVFPTGGKPQVLGIHDTTIWTNPEWHFFRRTDEIGANTKRIQDVDAVIVHTDHVAAQVSDMGLIPRQRIHVVPHGVDLPITADDVDARIEAERFNLERLARHRLTSGYVLYLGTIEPRKNLSLLFDAYKEIPKAIRMRHPLVIAGAPGWKTGPIYAAAATLQAEGSIRFIGRVDERELSTVYSNAKLFVYPSLEEGFGFPPLEAMAHGVATLVSDAPALVEVSGPGAVVLSREDPSGWAQTIVALLADDAARAELAERGRVHAAAFTWRATAERTINVYRKVIAHGGR